MIPVLVVAAYLVVGVVVARGWHSYTDPRNYEFWERTTRDPSDYALLIMFWPFYAVGSVIRLVAYGLARLGGYRR